MMINSFFQSVKESIDNNSFVRLTLSSPVNKKSEFKKLIVRLIELKGKTALCLTYRYISRDITKNHDVAEGLDILQRLAESEFYTARLFHTGKDIEITTGPGKQKIREFPPSFTIIPERLHDKTKERNISTENNKPYLHLLGLTDKNGKIIASSQDKFKQINQYIEILKPELEKLKQKNNLKVADMGSGKGYLTFALYDYLTSATETEIQMTGVEMRKELVDFCNSVAAQSDFSGLNFVESSISNYETGHVDILVALHACDTATDEAIAAGLKAEASMIVVAPCCHKQIRKQIEKTSEVKTGLITQYGIFLERQAELVTDAIRAAILEYSGYKMKVAEFIADAHTHKNVLIIATRSVEKTLDKQRISEEISKLKNEYGIHKHALETMTGMNFL